MITLVFEVILELSSLISKFRLCKSISQKITFDPTFSTIFAVETQDKAGTMTSSSGFRSRHSSAKKRADVQDVVATEYFDSVNLEHSD